MHQFDQDIEITKKKDFLYTARLTDKWSVNHVPNGGYLMAVMARAMMEHSTKRATPIIQASYVSRCMPGDVEVAVEPVSSSTQFDYLEARLIQDGTEKTRAVGTFASGQNRDKEKRYEASAPVIAPLDQCVPIPEIAQYSIFSRMDVRMDPACAGWLQGELTDRSEMKGWVRFKEERPCDLLSIFLIADSFPPPVIVSQGPVAWVPTLTLSVNVRNVPKSGWLKCCFRTRFINSGILEEDGQVWDEQDELIAISRQFAQYRRMGV